MLDHHLHVWPHEPGTPTPSFEFLERYCETAAARGITEIAITEHSHRFDRIINDVLPHWDRPLTGAAAEATAHVIDVEGGADLDAYVAALVDAQDRGLPLLVGLEVDFLPGTQEAMSSVLADYPFDILLGSVHWIDEWLFDAYGMPAFAEQWDTRDTDAVYSQYVDSVIELANSGAIDVLAHLDVIKITGHQAPRLAEHEGRLIDGIADSGVAIELSSAGFRKPVDDTYPSASLFDRLVERGMSITTSSDGHILDHIGWAYDHLRSMLDERSIDTLTTFRRRQPVPHSR